jgi:hypothetical protein
VRTKGPLAESPVFAETSKKWLALFKSNNFGQI